MHPNGQFPAHLWFICLRVCMSCFVSRVFCIVIGGARELSFGVYSLRGVRIPLHTAAYYAMGVEGTGACLHSIITFGSHDFVALEQKHRKNTQCHACACACSYLQGCCWTKANFYWSYHPPPPGGGGSHLVNLKISRVSVLSCRRVFCEALPLVSLVLWQHSLKYFL